MDSSKPNPKGMVTLAMAWDVWSRGNRVNEYSAHVQEEMKAAFYAGADSLMTISAAISFAVDESMRGKRHRELMHEILVETGKRE